MKQQTIIRVDAVTMPWPPNVPCHRALVIWNLTLPVERWREFKRLLPGYHDPFKCYEDEITDGIRSWFDR